MPPEGRDEPSDAVVAVGTALPIFECALAASRRRPSGFRVPRGHRVEGVPEQSRQPVGLGLLAMMRWAAGFEVLVGGRPVVGHGIDVVPLQAIAAVTSLLDTAQAVEVGRRTQL